MDISKMSVGELARAWKTSTIGTDEYHTELTRRLEAAETKAALLTQERQQMREALCAIAFVGNISAVEIARDMLEIVKNAATDTAREVRSE